MSRLEVKTPDRAQAVVEQMYRNMERRIAASPRVCALWTWR